MLLRAFEMPPYDVIKALVKECINHYASGVTKDPAWASYITKEIPSARLVHVLDECVRTLTCIFLVSMLFFSSGSSSDSRD